SPSLTYTSSTLPATVVTMSFCIFIASSTATTSPSFTSSPALTGSLTIRPCIGAITVPSPVRGGAGAAGAAPEDADVATEPGTTVIPAPLTRTLNTSPSTSTSNSALTATGGGGGAAGACGAGGAGSGAGGGGRRGRSRRRLWRGRGGLGRWDGCASRRCLGRRLRPAQVVRGQLREEQ